MLLDVEHRRQRHARALAVVDRHRPVGTLGHDLHRRPCGGGDFHPNQPEAEIAQDRRGDPADAQACAGVLDETRLVQPLDGRGTGVRAALRPCDLAEIKKSGSLPGPTLNTSLHRNDEGL